MNRRDFLKMTAAAGTLPLFHVGCAGFGLGRQAQLAGGATIRIAIVGCGRMRAFAQGDLEGGV